MEKSILMRMAASLPIVGNAVAMWIEHIQIGSLRGALVGLVIALAILTASEAVIAVFDVVREYVKLHWTATPLTEIRISIMADEDKKIYDNLIHPGAEHAANNIDFYAVRNLWTSVYDDNPISFGDLLANDPEVISRGSQRVDDGVRIVPFFRYNNADMAVSAERKVVATVTDPETKAEYVVAQFSGRLILIPLRDYQAAGLPVKGGR